jgi:hypothetical protein
MGYWSEHTCISSHMPHSARCACHTANSNPKLCATRNSKSRTSAGAVLGIRVVYLSRDIGLFVVLVAKNKVVNLKRLILREKPGQSQAHITFFGCQSMTVFFR